MYLLVVPAIGYAHVPFQKPKSRLSAWWSNFCERHLVADDPWQYVDDELLWLRDHGGGTYPEELLRRYKAIGAEAYWGRSINKTAFGVLGDYMRAWKTEDPRFGDALFVYSRYEKHPQR